MADLLLTAVEEKEPNQIIDQTRSHGPTPLLRVLRNVSLEREGN
jgi:hypothetical protein